MDLLVPYGYVDVQLKTFHAFGDQLLREHALKVGLTSGFRVLSQAEQLVFLRQHVFHLPLEAFRPLTEPTRYLEALAAVFGRAKDEAAGPEEFLACADLLDRQAAAAPQDAALRSEARRVRELAESYATYQRLLREADAADFGDLVLLSVQLLERHPEVLAGLQRRFRSVLVDEFQDTNYAQFRLLQLLAPPAANVTVVADDDQSIYKWRGAAISNVLKFLEHYAAVQTVVLTENFRSPQPLLDAAYRLIRFNDPDRLEVRQGIDKKLIARAERVPQAPHFQVFDTVSSEADWVAQTIRELVASGARRPSDVAILVRSNREADLFLRALNVAGVPWQFSGASGLFAREECKMLISCLKTLADPDDSLSWYHVASSPLYRCPMADLTRVLSTASKTHRSFRAVLEREPAEDLELSEAGRETLDRLRQDVQTLQEFSRTHSSGQVLYQWLKTRGYLTELGRGETTEAALQLQSVARFFDQLRRVEELAGTRLPELMQHLELFQAMGRQSLEPEDAWADQVRVLTIHKAKGLEFPVVFMVGLIQGRFPTPRRREAIELPEALIKDLLPEGDYHLQEERRLFYVAMTRAREALYLSCAYDYGGKTSRKVSQFVLEALELATPNPPAKSAGAKELLERSDVQAPLPVAARSTPAVLRLDAHGVDDYLTCPLKYRFSHLLRIPVMRHHLVVYGAALHKAVEEFFRRRLQGGGMDEAELLRVFDAHWSSEGFLTQEHETLRRAQAVATLQRFHARQQAHPEHPTFIEEKFKFPLEDLLVIGRWDRVDRESGGAVIIDYKSSEVRDQAAADRRARESLQMRVYALAWRILHGELPQRVELRFLETDITGTARFSEEDLEQVRGALRQSARGIRAEQFEAKPQEFSCHWCAFQAICPSAFHAR